MASRPEYRTTSTRAATCCHRFRAAFQATAADRDAIAEEELIQVNADIGAGVQIILAAVPRVAALREQMAALPMQHDLIDRLDVFARAAGHAQAVYAVASAPPQQLQQVYDEALAKRTTLRSDVQNLVTHGLVQADALGGIRMETGYRNVGYDLMGLVAIFRTAGERIVGRTVTQSSELDEAELLANQLIEMTAQRDDNVVVPANVVSDRTRAFTLLVRAYDETRRAVHFLFWGTDEADKIAPSIYGGKARKKSDPASAQKKDDPGAVVEPVAPVANEPAPVAPGAKGGPAFS